MREQFRRQESSRDKATPLEDVLRKLKAMITHTK
jgi:hypothetical protein